MGVEPESSAQETRALTTELQVLVKLQILFIKANLFYKKKVGTTHNTFKKKTKITFEKKTNKKRKQHNTL